MTLGRMPLLKVIVAFSKTEVEFTCLTLILGFLRAVFNNMAVITVSFIGHYYELVRCSYCRFVVPPLLKRRNHIFFIVFCRGEKSLNANLLTFKLL